jgi:hypothetical protein
MGVTAGIGISRRDVRQTGVPSRLVLHHRWFIGERTVAAAGLSLPARARSVLGRSLVIVWGTALVVWRHSRIEQHRSANLRTVPVQESATD